MRHPRSVLSVIIVIAGLLVAAPAVTHARSATDRLLDAIPKPTKTEINDQPARDTYVAEIANSKANVAIVVRRGIAVGYVCDGTAKATRWLRGTVSKSGRIRLHNPRGGTITARLRRGTIRGTIRLSGRSLRFNARKARKGLTGLYRQKLRIDGKDVLRGWIVASAPKTLRLTGIDELDGGKLTVGTSQTVDTSTGQSIGDGPPPPPPVPESVDGDCVDWVPGGCGASCATLIAMEAANRRTVGFAKTMAVANLYNTAANDYLFQIFENGCFVTGGLINPFK